ncbi:MAG TPA: mechanosensitive ion channel [Spirochaetota bacterium]|nr:mechanosensitive ion channel [Spirochaetota bacterium]
MNHFYDWIQTTTGVSIQFQSRMLHSMVIILLLWIVRSITIRIIWRRTENPTIRYRWRKTTAYIAVCLALIIVGREWFTGIQSIATIVGLISAGLAIALQDIIKSIAGWVFILWRKPFSVGDRIQVGNHAGDVIDIRIFQFSLMEIGNWVDAEQSTGRVIHIPNSAVWSETVANYSGGFEYIWNEIPILVTFESNWVKAKNIILEITEKHAVQVGGEAEKRIKEASKRYMIFYSTLTPTVYTSVRNSGILLTIRYLIEPRKRRATEQLIWEDVLRSFAECDDIDFAYPTQRFFDNRLEGKIKSGE